MENFLKIVSTLDPIAVVLSAFAIVAVGWLWYSHLLFGRAWIRLTGVRPGDIRPADMQRNVAFSIITALIAAGLLGLIAEHHAALPMMMIGTLFVWLFVMLEQLNGFIWRREPFALFLLQTSRSLISLLAGGLVFTFFH